MLQMRLFGGMEVVLDGVPSTPPPSRRAWSLLAWLGLNPGMTARARVASRFWPDVLDTSARASLRSAILSLRGALGPAADDYLRGDPTSSGWPTPAGCGSMSWSSTGWSRTGGSARPAISSAVIS